MPGNIEFANENFNADDYVKRLVKERVAGSELSEYKKQLQKEKEDVSVKTSFIQSDNIFDNLQISYGLKKKVFENYTQFIETAREISRKQL